MIELVLHFFVDGVEPDKQNVFTRLLHGETNFIFSVINVEGKAVYRP